jgi:hypothetical protein
MYSALKLPILVTFLGAFVLLFCGVAAWADWDPNEPAKYYQLPDAVNGMDVNATYWVTPGNQPLYPYNKMLADDFPCYQKGPITDLHIWGSWLGDVWTADNQPSAAVNLNTSFKLSIWSDVPKADAGTYSHPGELLWSQTFSPSQYVSRPYGGATSEMFYDPNTNQIIGDDTRIWQYNFFIDPANAFVQQGTREQPMIYWLSVQALVPVDPVAPVSQRTVFGWKTTAPVVPPNTLFDDAVFADSAEPGGLPIGSGTVATPWKDMVYPAGSVYVGKSLDLAFVVTPEPSSIAMLVIGSVAGILFVIRRRKA